MLRRLGIRGKILAVVAVPILVLVLAAGFVTINAFSDLQSAQNASQLIDTLDAAGDLETDLQTERRAAMSYTSILQTGQTNLSAAETATGAALVALQTTVNAADSAAGDALLEDVEAVLGGSTLNEILSEERALEIVPAAEEGAWPTFPSAADTQTMLDSYAAKEAELDEIAADAPDAFDALVSAIAFQVGFEGRAASALYSEPLSLIEELEAVYPRVDEGLASLASSAAGIADTEANARLRATASDVARQGADLPAARASIQAGSSSEATTLSVYTNILRSVLGATGDVTLAVGNRDVVATLQGYGAMQSLVEAMQYEEVVTDRLIRAGVFLSGESSSLRGTVERTNVSLENAQAATIDISGVDPAPGFGASQGDAGEGSNSFISIRTNLTAGTSSALTAARNQEWSLQVDEELAAQYPVRDQVWSRTLAIVSDTATAVATQTIITIAIALIALVGSLLFALVIARRIVNPLRRLTTTATAVRQELPRLVERVAMPGETVDMAEVQIPVESSDEIGRLAEAFNGVNAATLAIASEQSALRGSISEMFVNVARRDQVLLNRQLQSIDEMERTEDNPETLTRLFALDHLATRMRRNSESLLVLAGIDTGRRLRRAMPLSDVIRTASSEIELYERVELELDADPSMLGHSSLTAAHLFAELLENATVFSDPGTPVVVSTEEVDGNYVVRVKDSGIGMNAQELQEANNRVMSTAASEILGAQRLGLFVVGRIARRIGARVTLESTEGAGTVATVWLSASMFDPQAHVDEVHTHEANVDERLHAPAALVSHVATEDVAEAPAAPVRDDSYQPTMAPSGVPLAGAAAVGAAAGVGAADALSVDDLIAADAADAPVAIPVDTDALTDGVGPNGLPTRRRREAPAPTQDESKNVIGLPVRATADQLSALEAESPSEVFAPPIPANEVSPQTPEDRAQMFRGFRARRAYAAEGEAIDPEAESLGHAARRGAIAPEDIPALAAAQIPMLEDDDGADATASSGSLDGDDDFAADAVADAEAPMVIPVLEDDDEDEYGAPEAIEADVDGAPAVEQPVLEEDPAAYATELQEEAPAAPAEPAAYGDEYAAEYGAQAPVADEPAISPYSYADAYASSAQAPPAEPQAWTVDQVSLDEPAAEPSLDEIIAPSAGAAVAKASFFGRLFGRGKKDAAAPAAAAAATQASPFQPTGEAAAPAPIAEPEVAPSAASFAPAPGVEQAFEPDSSGQAEPAYEQAPASSVAEGGAYEQAAYETPSYDAPAYDAPAYEGAGYQETNWADATPATPEPAAPEPVSPGGAFALWGDKAQHATPAPAATGQVFTPDELASPYGWEVAGDAALAAAAPEAATEYEPVVDLQPEADMGGAHETEITSAVFSELSSLSYERPVVEKTNAGLQRRRAAGETAPEVKPIEPEVHLAHKERDADEVRSRFSSFYSGTQRARSDVQEFEQRSHPAEVKE